MAFQHGPYHPRRDDCGERRRPILLLHYRCQRRHGLYPDRNGQTGCPDWTMEYEAGGLRTKRSSAEKTYNYIYNGNQLVRMRLWATTSWTSPMMPTARLSR